MKRSDMPNDAQRPTTGADAERRFAERVRRALEASAANLPEATVSKLVFARKAALRAQRQPALRRAPVAQWAMAGGAMGPGSPRLGFARAGLVFSAFVLVGACLAGLYQFEQDRRIEELADVDTGVLNDDLPISAYADQGFNAYLKQNP